jgi:hypothetical protein
MVNFITENTGIDAFQKGTKFIQDTDANDQRLAENTAGAPFRLKSLAGNANSADAKGQVDQRTIEDNVAQEKTATQQGRSNLRSTELGNQRKEVEALLTATEAYAAGNVDVGDEIVRKNGSDPNSDTYRPIRENATYAGAINRTIKAAGGINARPADIAQRITATSEGFKNGTVNQTDPAAPYRNDIPGAPAADSVPIHQGRSAAGLRIGNEQQLREGFIAAGYPFEQAAAMAKNPGGIRPDAALRLAQRRADAEIKSRFQYSTPTTADLAEINERAQREVQEDLRALMPQKVAPPGGSPISAATPPAPGQQPAQPPARVEPPASSPITQATPPAPPGTPTPTIVNRPPPPVTELVPTTAAPAPVGPEVKVVDKASAAKLPAGSRVVFPTGAKAVRVDTPEQAAALEPNTVFILPDGRSKTTPPAPVAQ